ATTSTASPSAISSWSRGPGNRERSEGAKLGGTAKARNDLCRESAKERKSECRQHGRGGPVGTASSLHVYPFRSFALSLFRAKCRFASSLLFALSPFLRKVGPFASLSV